MSRPRGFVEYKPQSRTMALIKAVQEILAEYRNQLPLTLRQIFYRAVSMGILGKTENDYERLCEIMNRARRGRLINMRNIRDDGFKRVIPEGWDDEQQLIQAMQNEIEFFRLDRQQGQRERLIVWCEAGGMVPQLVSVAKPYGVPVCSSGGFDSVTAKHDAAQWISEQGNTTVLHIGDRDPSGVHMFGALDEDITAFIGHYRGNVNFIRLAVTPEQVEEYHLPTSPPKGTDKRKFSGLTTQAEALDPQTLANIVKASIEDRQDSYIRDEVIERETELKQTLRERISIN